MEDMNYIEEVMEPEFNPAEAGVTGSGVGIAAAVAIGLGLATAVAWLGVNVWKKHKANKEQVPADEHDFVVPSEAEIEAVTK